jgi:ABC-2 type transport system permease protein
MYTEGISSQMQPGLIQSLSRPISAWTMMTATMVKELKIARRYLPNLIGNFVQLILRVAFFLLLANSVMFRGVGPAGLEFTGRNMFIFFQGALLLLVFNGPTLWGPINTVSRDLYDGTLEFLYSNPGSRYAYYVGSVLAEVLISLVVFLPFYVFLSVSSKASFTNMLMVLLVCIMVGITLTAMGVLIALLALLWRQVGSIANVLGMLFEFLAGAYFPVSSFPPIIRYLAYPLPYTWGYDLIRYYSFAGKWTTIFPVWQEWSILFGYALLYTILSRYLLKKAEQRAKQTGLHVI